MDAALLKELSKYAPTDISDKRPFINALLYGDWGVGKTSVACSSGRPTLIISSGDGGESVLRNNSDNPRFSETVSIVQCQGLSHIKAIFAALIEQHPDYKHYEVLVIDTISSICDQYLRNLVDNYTIAKDRTTAKPKTTGQIMETSGQGDYKFLTSHIQDLAPVSTAVPADVIWLSHEREPSWADQEKGNYLTRPKIPEKSADAIAEVCTLVGNLEKKKQGKDVKRTLNFNGSDRLAAKSRIAALEGKTIDVDDFWMQVEVWRS